MTRPHAPARDAARAGVPLPPDTTCRACGKRFRDYRPPLDRGVCSVGCEWSDDTDYCAHGFVAALCVHCNPPAPGSQQVQGGSKERG